MTAVDSEASDGSEIGRTTPAVKEMEQGKPYFTNYLIRPHIATSPATRATIQDAKKVWDLHHP